MINPSSNNYESYPRNVKSQHFMTQLQESSPSQQNIHVNYQGNQSHINQYGLLPMNYIPKRQSIKQEYVLSQQNTAQFNNNYIPQNGTQILFQQNYTGNKDIQGQQIFYKNLYQEEKLKYAESLFSKNVTTVNCSRQLQMYQKTVQTMKVQYQKYGRILRQGEKQKLQKQKKAQEFAEIRKLIVEIVQRDNSLGLRGIRYQLQKLGIKKQLGEISMYMKGIRNVGKSSFIQKNDIKEKQLQNSQASILTYCRIISDVDLQRLIFIDQITLSQNSTSINSQVPSTHLQQELNANTQSKKHTSQQPNQFTLIVAASVNGFQSMKWVDGKFKVQHFLEFLGYDLQNTFSDSIIILDNAKVHHLEEVKETLKTLNLNVCYLPYQRAYFPQLNPMENILQQIKFNFLAQKDCCTMNSEQGFRIISNSIKTIETKFFPKKIKEYQQTLRKTAEKFGLSFN